MSTTPEERDQANVAFDFWLASNECNRDVRGAYDGFVAGYLAALRALPVQQERERLARRHEHILRARATSSGLDASEWEAIANAAAALRALPVQQDRERVLGQLDDALTVARKCAARMQWGLVLVELDRASTALAALRGGE